MGYRAADVTPECALLGKYEPHVADDGGAVFHLLANRALARLLAVAFAVDHRSCMCVCVYLFNPHTYKHTFKCATFNL